MKTIVYYVILLFILLSCVNNSNGGKEQDGWENAVTAQIKGLIEQGNNNQLCIIENWESRSRVSYYVYGEYLKELENSIGKITVVSGKVIEESRFTKKILVEKIISIE